MIFTVQIDDGRRIRVEAETAEDAAALVEAMLADEEAAAPPAPERPAGQELGRQMALKGIRAPVEAAAGIAGLVVDPLRQVYGMATGQEMRPYREAVGEALTGVGVPVPETGLERVTQAGTEAMIGGGGLGVAGRMIAGAPGRVGQVGRFLAERPIETVTSSLAAGTAQQATAEAGGGPLEQLAAGLGAGMGPSVLRSLGELPMPGAAQAPGMPDVQVDVRVPRAPEAAPVSQPAAEPMSAEDLGKLVQPASTGGWGSAKALERLAEVAKVNPEAKAAADRLGIELPADIFSDHRQLREAAGLTRSIAGSEASAAFRDQIEAAATRADDVLAQMDASPDLSSVSAKVLSDLKNTQAQLKTQADNLYSKIDARVPKNTEIEPDNVVRTLSQVIREMGGPAGLTAQERNLYAMVTDAEQPITYARLMREKALIGKAIDRQDSPYGNMDIASLKRLYTALSEDQLANVQRIGGTELRGNLRLANQITAKRKALETRLTQTFGQDVDGSITRVLRTAIQQGARGDNTALVKALKIMPPELRREAIASTISALSRSARAAEPGFGFAEFTKLYSGLRQNNAIYKQLVDILGPQGHQTMLDLYQISKRVTDARAQVLTTGKANQALVQAMTAEGLVQKALNSTIGRRTVQGTAGAAGAFMGGPVGAAGGAMLAAALTKDKDEALTAAGRMFRSDEFKELAVSIAIKPRVPETAIRRVENSTVFKTWARAAGIDDPKAWLRGAIATSQATGAAQPVEAQ